MRRQLVVCDFCDRECHPDTVTEALPFTYCDPNGGGAYGIDVCGECAATRTLADVSAFLLARRKAQAGTGRLVTAAEMAELLAAQKGSSPA